VFRLGQANDEIYVLMTGSVRVSLNQSLFAIEGSVEDDFGPDDELNPGEMHHDPDVKPSAQIGRMSKIAAALKGPKLKVAMPFASRSPGGSRNRLPPEWNHKVPVRAPVLEDAVNQLKKQDVHEKWAAKYIQRRWRSRIANIVKQEMRHHEQQQKNKASVKSRSVPAPAYFGESCLWVPLEDWETREPPKFDYSARCEVRCEILYITRSELKDIVDQFSPWLTERFTYFTSKVYQSSAAHHAEAHPEEAPSPVKVGSDSGRPPSRLASKGSAWPMSGAGPLVQQEWLPSDAHAPPGAGLVAPALDKDWPQVSSTRAASMQATSLVELQARWADLANRSRTEATRLINAHATAARLGSRGRRGRLGSSRLGSLRDPLLSGSRA